MKKALFLLAALVFLFPFKTQAYDIQVDVLGSPTDEWGNELYVVDMIGMGSDGYMFGTQNSGGSTSEYFWGELFIGDSGSGQNPVLINYEINVGTQISGMSSAAYLGEGLGYNDQGNTEPYIIDELLSVSTDNQSGGSSGDAHFPGDGGDGGDDSGASNSINGLIWLSTNTTYYFLAQFDAPASGSDIYDANANFMVESAPTPIPGAVWLLGSGLVGLIGLRKKRHQ